MKVDFSKMTDEELAAYRAELADALECLSDCEAEILGERARFGDSGPGTQKTLDECARVRREDREAFAEWLRRNPEPVREVSDADDDCPF